MWELLNVIRGGFYDAIARQTSVVRSVLRQHSSVSFTTRVTLTFSDPIRLSRASGSARSDN